MLKKAVPACFGACLGGTLLEAIRHPDLWDLSAFLSNFIFTFVFTALLVTLCFWIWAQIQKCRHSDSP